MSSVNLSSAQKSKIQSKLAENENKIKKASPADALTTIRAILVDAGVSKEKLNEVICETSKGRMAVKSMATSIYDKMRKEHLEEEKEKEAKEKGKGKEKEKENEEEDENEQDGNKNDKNRVRSHYGARINISEEKMKELKEKPQSESRRWLEAEVVRQMRAQGLSEAEINNPVDNVSLTGKDGLKQHCKAGTGKTFKDLAVDSVMAKVYGQSRSQLMGESKDQTREREAREDNLGKAATSNEPVNGEDVTVQSGDDSLQVVDEILNGFMMNGQISEADLDTLEKLTGTRDLNALVPAGMMYNRNDD
ncbi:MAG: hypothetical protein IKB06_02460 [Clostridia bacterium]|nr:hypothetical protein [Clostridia bacterium]